MKKTYIQAGVGVVALALLIILGMSGGDGATTNVVEDKTEDTPKNVEVVVGGQGTGVKLPTPTSYAPGKEFPFNFTEKNLIKGSPFGEFKYDGFDYADYHRFTGSATVSGQVVLVKSDGTHNLGIRVDKADAYKLPQYYLATVASADGSRQYDRSVDPYTVCFGYYYPLQYNNNGLLDKLATFAGQKVTVNLFNYKIIVAKDHVGPCANLAEIVSPR